MNCKNYFVNLNLLATFLLLSALPLDLYGQSKTPVVSTSTINSVPRYALVGNWLDDEKEWDPNDPKVYSRHVEVLIERKDFSEKNLRTLLGLVSKRFPSPVKLFVNVYTDLDQVLTPEERDSGVTSEIEGGEERQHFWAIYVRTRNDEYFRYSPTNDLSGNILVPLKRPREK